MQQKENISTESPETSLSVPQSLPALLLPSWTSESSSPAPLLLNAALYLRTLVVPRRKYSGDDTKCIDSVVPRLLARYNQDPVGVCIRMWVTDVTSLPQRVLWERGYNVYRNAYAGNESPNCWYGAKGKFITTQASYITAFKHEEHKGRSK